jgi:AcrR family transcriptional regulator
MTGAYAEAASVFKLEELVSAPGPSEGASKRRLRADAARNRERLLEAARAVFARGGPEASFEAVARAAGVGAGTLYRHFPTREALFQAVYQREADELVELAGRLDEPPLAALRTWLRAAVRMIATKKGMVAALAPALDPSSPFAADTSARVRASLAALMARAVAAGELRADVTAEDAMRAVIGFCYTREQAGWQDAVVRLLDVFVDGLARPQR